MRGRRWALVATVIAGLTVVVSAGATIFQDPAGDQIDAASFTGPDITDVDVTNTPDGEVTIRAMVPNYPTLWHPWLDVPERYELRHVEWAHTTDFAVVRVVSDWRGELRRPDGGVRSSPNANHRS